MIFSNSHLIDSKDQIGNLNITLATLCLELFHKHHTLFLKGTCYQVGINNIAVAFYKNGIKLTCFGNGVYGV